MYCAHDAFMAFVCVIGWDVSPKFGQFAFQTIAFRPYRVFLRLPLSTIQPSLCKPLMRAEIDWAGSSSNTESSSAVMPIDSLFDAHLIQKWISSRCLPEWDLAFSPASRDVSGALFAMATVGLSNAGRVFCPARPKVVVNISSCSLMSGFFL